MIDRETLRPGFEAWYVPAHPKALNPLFRHQRGYYMKEQVEAAWRGWCAAMESLLTDEAVSAGAQALGCRGLSQYDDWTRFANARECILAAIGAGREG